MLRFVHAADIHLDSRLEGLSAYPGAPVELLRSATRRAFTALVDLVLEEGVDFLVIAGDLYDGDWRDYNTGLFFVAEMRRLDQAGIRVVIALGNHDAESELTRQLTLPANVTVFGTRKPETVRLDAHRVALHGQSFREAATKDNLAVHYPAPVPGWFNVGVLHTALEGQTVHANYAPCAVAELQARGYDYWALGHVHEHRVVGEAPWIVYPGNLQGRSVRELGPRGAVLVEETGGRVAVTRRPLNVVQWDHLELDVSGAKDVAEVVRRVGTEFVSRVGQLERRVPLAVRVTLTGRTAAHGELFRREEHLRAELLAAATALGDEVLWVEKVRVRTEPALDATTVQARADAVADLQALLDRAATDPGLLDELREDLAELVTRVPAPLLDRVPELAAIREGRLTELIQAVSTGLIARVLENTD
jgi:exonuclease SbcD